MKSNNFYTLYLEYVEFINVKLQPQSIITIKKRFNNYILPYFKNKNIDEITPFVYLEWQKKIDKKAFSFGYKKALHYTMVSFYSYLNLFYSININIPKQVGNFKNNDIPKEMSFLTFKEYEKFINIFEDCDFIYKAFFTILFHTGIRLGEALALKFNDFINDSLFINKTISKEYINGKKVETNPKTKESIRYIKLDNYTIDLINKIKNYYINNFKNFNNSFYIFGGSKSLSVTSITRKKNKYLKNAGINKNIRIHDFRHSHATFLLKNNVPIIEVSRRLGHCDINTTIKTYSHLTNDYEKKALQAFNSLTKFI